MADIAFVRGEVRYARVPGFPGYFAAEDGHVWSQWKPRRRELDTVLRRLRPGVNSSGYLQVALYRQGQRFYLIVSRVVLLSFVGPPQPGQEANHRDDDRTNNRLTNLFWASKSVNATARERRRKRKRT